MSETPMRVLIVDDEEAMRTALSRLLSLRGFEVTSAASGAEALRLAQPGCSQARLFDLVILDLWMPGMNGIETLTRFRKIDPWTPVIAVSAMGTDATAEACRAAGATGFLPKPFTADDIEDLAREAKTGRIGQEGVAAGAGQGWRGRLLVADDHAAYRQAVSRRLRLDGFDVDEVASGSAVAIIAEGITFDAMLLDIHMPNGDGLFAANAVRSRDPFLPILFMTGEANESEMRESLSSSTAGCLRKPVEMDSLGRMLEFLISAGKKSRQRAAAKASYDELPESRKAVIAVGSKLKQIRRSRETPRVIVGVVLCVLIALVILSVFDSGQRALMRVEQTVQGVPGPIDMYNKIVGYLERDEKRELNPQK